MADAAPEPRGGLREVDFVAAAAVSLGVAVTWFSRQALNPDGVSYLDLATALRHGEVAHFVQGYWSPLYPALIAGASAALGVTGTGMVAVGHALNLLALIGAAAVLWHWSRRMDTPFFGRVAFAALLTCAAGFPQVEAITPDVLLVAIAAWLSYELIAHRGRRWWLCGLLLGAAFLTKTSVWPWLIVSIPVRWWGAGDHAGRRVVMRSIGVAAAVMLVWIMPLSVRTGTPTLGMTGKLNYCRYLESCDSWSPDADRGGHVDYRDVPVAGAQPLAIATFPGAPTWTYEPWSDPTAWQAGVTPRAPHQIAVAKYLRYWLLLAGQVFKSWLLPMLVAVLLPMVIAGRRPGMLRDLVTDCREALVVALLGLVGLGQFIAVHAEPRLIAPFALMLALGILTWCCATAPQSSAANRANGPVRRAPRWLWQVASSLGFVAVAIQATSRVREGIAGSRDFPRANAALAAATAQAVARSAAQPRIVIIGPAIPVDAAAYWVGGHIVAQLLPRSMSTFAALPAERQIGILDSLFAGQADVAWMTTPDSQIQIVAITSAPAAR